MSKNTNMPPTAAYSSAGNLERDNERFSDSSSSYWPQGWNWARYSDPDADFSTLSEEEQNKMRNGLQQVLGDDGMRRLWLHLDQKAQELEDKRLNESGAAAPEYNPPDFMKQWQKRHRGGSWGFVAFRTALYDDENEWAEFERRIQCILNVAFDQVVQQHRGHEYEEVAEARKSFKLQWVQDEELEGATAETLRKQYIEFTKNAVVPVSMDYNMFLCASPEAVESVLSLDTDNLPTTKSSYWRDDAPFLLVVMKEETLNPHGDDEEYDPADPHHESNWYKSVFKVPVEIVPDILWDLIDRDYISPTRITRGVKGSTELGGTMPENYTVDGLSELWWGMGPSPRSLERRRRLRGL